MIFKTLEDKCRYFQGLNDYRLMPNSYILVHCDGRSFSRLIKRRFEKPFDEKFVQMMDETAKFLCEKVSGCKLAFTQSDEISLLLEDTPETDIFFGGRMCKMISIIASMATGCFNKLLLLNDLEDGKTTVSDFEPVQFDCKVWNVPSVKEAYSWFRYRQIDCLRNSKQQFAQTYVSAKKLNNLNTDEQIKLTFETTGNDWNEIREGLKSGRFFVKKMVAEKISYWKYQKSIKVEETVSKNKWIKEEGVVLTENGSLKTFEKLLNDGNEMDDR